MASKATPAGLMALGTVAWGQVVAVSRAQERKDAAAQKWEYKILMVDTAERTGKPDEEKFTDLGEQGWELVGSHGHLSRAYFKRPKR